MFGDVTLTIIFNSPKEASEYQHLRDLSNETSADTEATKDRNPHIVEWNEDNLKNYNYIYKLTPYGIRVIKEIDEHENFIAEDWELL